MREYLVDVHGVEHTMLLDEDEAKARNAKPVQDDAKPAKTKAPQNKARAAAAAK